LIDPANLLALQDRRKYGLRNKGMKVRPLRTKADHRWALKEVERLWDAEPGTPEGDHVDVLVTLIEAYEAKHFPIPAPDPIAAIEFMLEQKGLTRRDLEPAIGSRGRVSEVMTRKRPLTLPMVRALSKLLQIPTEILARAYPLKSAA
jgi:HTH-type transcriptional regulator/antitoxin HigA